MNKAHALDLKKEFVNDKAINSALGASFFIIAMALGAYVRIPVPGSPVPITLQTFFVLLSGAVLGKRLGLFTTLSYAAISALFLLGPTGGYFAGFAAASYLIGSMLEKKEADMGRILAAFAIGILTVYTFGVLWLVSAYKMNIVSAITLGALPFVAGDAVKVAIAASIYKKIAPRSKEIFGA
jgi:biotin transport system substrate-specific component